MAQTRLESLKNHDTVLPFEIYRSIFARSILAWDQIPDANWNLPHLIGTLRRSWLRTEQSNSIDAALLGAANKKKNLAIRVELPGDLNRNDLNGLLNFSYIPAPRDSLIVLPGGLQLQGAKNINDRPELISGAGFRPLTEDSEVGARVFGVMKHGVPTALFYAMIMDHSQTLVTGVLPQNSPSIIFPKDGHTKI